MVTPQRDGHDLQKIIEEVIVLAQRQSYGKPPKIQLSKETASLLTSISEQNVYVSSPSNTIIDPQAKTTVSSEEVTSRPGLLPPDSSSQQYTLESIKLEIATCTKCHLHKTRQNTVPGEGNIRAQIVFVGEAPGASEDREGRPFVGRAGQLLTDIITKGMKMRREDVFICNVLKCRPPDNRTPSPEEVYYCEPYLIRQLDCIRPKVICALGGVAAQTLLKTSAPIYNLRGIWHDYHGIALRVTYHPSYLLRNPEDKAKTWEDIQEIMRFLNHCNTQNR